MSTSVELTVVSLPGICDANAAASLAARLVALRGGPVGIDASCVEKVSTLSLQVLISARITWKADRMAFSIQRSSQAFRQAVGVLGLQTLLRKSEN